jgi:sulfate adenylyltransferase (ADP) / ATP adenylyltransferase
MFWNQAKFVSEKALADGELLPIATKPQEVNEQGIRFRLHIKNDNMRQKITEAKTDRNPFLPFEESMFVSPAGDSHVCLLNRFPVLDDHLLICSNQFEEQSAPMSLENFRAWLLGFDQEDVFGFYNGGSVAGASQPHRHMQLVRTELPMQARIVTGNLPFRHRLFKVDQLDASRLHEAYLQAMGELGLLGPERCLPYNLLLTSEWMLLLPRTQKSLDTVFLNGLNYAGIFLMRNNQHLVWAQNYGFLNILKACSVVEG